MLALHAITGSFQKCILFLVRILVSAFLSNATGQTVAIRSAEGISKIISNIVSGVGSVLPIPDAIGIILDADDEGDVSTRFKEFKDGIKAKDSLQTLIFSDTPGVVHCGLPKTGIFIMPNNSDPGTLEKVLLKAADTHYSELKAEAISFVDRAKGLVSSDEQEAHKNAGLEKAQVAAMGAILRPGKAIQVSIQDNRWLKGDSLNDPSVKAVSGFLAKLMA